MAKTRDVLLNIKRKVNSLSEATQTILFSLKQQLNALDMVRNNIATINEEISGFQKIFGKLQNRIIKTRSSIKTVHENISSFNIGILSTVIKGIELFSDWLSKLPNAPENPLLVDYEQSALKEWFDKEANLLKNRGFADLINELEESIESAFRKAKEIVKSIKEGETNDSLFEELEVKALKVIEIFEKLAERVEEND